MSPTEDHPYDRHVGRYGQALARGLIDVARVSEGQLVLDVGCGTGQLTLRLAQLTGGERVAAVDLAKPALAVCRSRVPAADVRVASAEDLPFDDGTFDGALAQLVVNLVEHPQRAVAEMRRVVRAGGVIAACFWDDDEMPYLRSIWDAIGAVVPEALADVGEETRVGVQPEVMREWWTDAGLRDVLVGRFEVSADYECFDDLWAPFESGVGHSGKTYLSLGDDERAAVRALAHRRLGFPQGAFRLTAGVRTVRGVK